MKRNEAILAELMRALEEIKNKIHLKKIKLYDNEINSLQDTIEQSLKVTHRSSWFEKNEVVKCIMKMIDAINHEIESIEIEMQGLVNYSSYETLRIDDMVLKQAIKNDLDAMLRLIIQARPEVRNSELSGILKMLA